MFWFLVRGVIDADRIGRTNFRKLISVNFSQVVFFDGAYFVVFEHSMRNLNVAHSPAKRQGGVGSLARQ